MTHITHVRDVHHTSHMRDAHHTHGTCQGCTSHPHIPYMNHPSRGAPGGSPTAPGMQQGPGGRSRAAERFLLPGSVSQPFPTRHPRATVPSAWGSAWPPLTFLSFEDEEQTVPVHAGWDEFDLAWGVHGLGSISTYCL